MKALPNLLTGLRLALSLFVFFALATAAGDMPGLEPRRRRDLRPGPLGGVRLRRRGVTDFFDGWLARRLDATSVWGAILDPIADKVLVCATVLGLMALAPSPMVVDPGRADPVPRIHHQRPARSHRRPARPAGHPAGQVEDHPAAGRPGRRVSSRRLERARPAPRPATDPGGDLDRARAVVAGRGRDADYRRAVPVAGAQSAGGRLAVELLTARLRLRRAAPEDVEALHEILSDPVAMRFWSSPPHRSLEQSRVWLDGMIADGPPLGEDFVIEHQRRVIGKAGCWRLPEIGYILHPRHWGQGFAAEACSAAIAHIFATYDLPAITADVDPRNEASLRLLARLGFAETGRATATYEIEGEISDSIYLALGRGG
jgi:ribosomal-protein-alanine N-acetyltransferase